MKSIDSTYGRKIVSSGKKIIEILESGICDSCYCSNASQSVGELNLFGRKINKSSHSDPSYALGTALSGLRSAITLESERRADSSIIRQAIRSHVPLVITAVRSHVRGETVSDPGCFQFFAGNNQELIDFIILSHKIAELLLVPGVVILDGISGSTLQNAELPRADLIREFLGRPEDRINTPTPAQEIIFGPKRRRIPNWFNYDNPVMGATLKDSQSLTNEMVANQRFFYAHLEEIITQAFVDYYNLTGRKPDKVGACRMEDAKYVFLAQGVVFHQACAVVDYLRSAKIKAGCANISLVKPFPVRELSQLLSGKKAVAVLDNSFDMTGDSGLIYNELKSLIRKLKIKEQPDLFSAFSGRASTGISNHEIVGLFEHMISGSEVKQYGAGGVEPLQDFSGYPRLEAHLQNVDRHYPQFVNRKTGESKLAYEAKGAPAFAVAIQSKAETLNTDNFSKKFLRLIADQFETQVFGVPQKGGEYLFYASRDKSPGLADLENKLDVFVTDSGMITSELLNRLKPNSWIVLLPSPDIVKPLSVSKAFKVPLEEKNITLLTVPHENKSELNTRLSGLLVKKFNGLFNAEISDSDLKALRNSFYSNYFSETEALPEDQFIEAFKNIYRIEDLNWIDTSPNKLELPLAVRRYKDHGAPFTGLAQFYNYTSHFFESGSESQLVPEPFQAVPFVPAAASDLISMTGIRQQMPLFKPEACSGCGDCFIYCPHSAIPPIAIHVEALLKSAMSMANSKGQSLSKFTPLIKNLAKISNRIINKAEAIREISDFLPAAFDELINQMKPAADKLETLNAEFNILMDIIGSFQVAVTNPFFRNPETMEKGSGELFSLAIDPNACTGCGICDQVCPENALEMVPQQPADVERAMHQFSLWEQLPDTTGETITRLYHDDQYQSLGAILLSRNFYLSLVGPSPFREDYAVKTLVHLITAVTESIVQPKFAAKVEEINLITTALSENIHSKLSEAIPRGDLESFLQAFETDKRVQIPLDDLLEKVGLEKSQQSVNALELQRKIELLRQLKNLHWSISEGPTGVGRARFGATIANSEIFEWASRYPANNFCSPVVLHWNSQGSQLALGLFEGNLQHQLDNIKLLRRAELEIKDGYVPNEHDEIIASLEWSMLTEKEKELIPPLLLIMDLNEMEEPAESLNKILHSDYPVKVMVMNRLSKSPDALLKGFSLMVGSLISRNVSLYQISLADQDSFTKSLLQGLKSDGPALFHVGVDEWTHPVNRNLPVDSRVFPVITTRPDPESPLLSSSVDLTANPLPESDWVPAEYTYHENEKEVTLDYRITSADWLSLLPALESHFTSYSEDKGVASFVADFISLNSAEAKGKVPVILRINKEGLLTRFCVSNEVIDLTKQTKMIWDTWREISGALQIIPEAVKSKLEKEISNKYEEEIRTLKSDHSQKMKQLEDQHMSMAKKKLVDKLLYLYHKSKTN